MSFVSKRDAYDLSDFIYCPFDFDNHHYALSDYGTIDLYPYGILACGLKFLDFKVQLESFEE